MTAVTSFHDWQAALHRMCDVDATEYPSVDDAERMHREGLTPKQAHDRLIACFYMES